MSALQVWHLLLRACLLCRATMLCHAMPCHATCRPAVQCNAVALRLQLAPCCRVQTPSLPFALPLQSCAMLGIFSYFVDGMGGGEAKAAALRSTPAAAAGTASTAPAGEGAADASGSSSRQQQEEQLRQWQQQRKAVEQFLSPVMPLLAAAAPCVFAWNEGSGSPAGGCRVVRRR